MINEKEAQDLITKLFSLREQAVDSKDSKLLRELQAHETLCMEKFRYLVTMRTNRYKSFSNYDDLNQEGFEALLKAMKNYNPKKGIFFYWAHKYIETRISRSANLHTTIRFPLKFAKANTPHKESTIPVMIEPRFNPDKILESSQVTSAIQAGMHMLNDEQKEVVNFAFGFTGDKPLSISKICKHKNLSRSACMKTLDSALNVLKDNIKL